MSAIATHMFAPTVIRKAAEMINASEADILSGKRDPLLCEARYAIWHAMREQGSTLGQIGRRFRRDHTTIINGLKRAETLMSNPYFAQFVKDIAG